MRNFLIALLALAVLAALGAGWYLMRSPELNQTVACTDEAKICPDGTAVGRSGPKCEFTACPTATTTAPSTSYINASYIVEGTVVTFKDGISSVPAAPGSASMVVTKYFGNSASGDLNGDGLADVAFLITQNPGGSGTFYYVVAALKTAGGYTGTNAVLLGDRIAPQTTEVKKGEIVVNYAERKAGEPMTTQPSVGVSKYFKIENGKLVSSR